MLSAYCGTHVDREMLNGRRRRDNLEIVRLVDDAFLAGLQRGELAATGLVSEDHELILVGEFPGPRGYRDRIG